MQGTSIPYRETAIEDEHYRIFRGIIRELVGDIARFFISNLVLDSLKFKKLLELHRKS